MTPKILSIITPKNILPCQGDIAVARSTEASIAPTASNVARVCPKPQGKVLRPVSKPHLKTSHLAPESVTPKQEPKTGKPKGLMPKQELKAAKSKESKPKQEPNAAKPKGAMSSVKQEATKVAQSKKKAKRVKIVRAAPDFIYQAIGKLDTEVILRDRTFISLGGKEFRLLFNTYKPGKTFTKFQSILTDKGHDLSMIVYPQCSHLRDSEGNEVSNSAFTFVREYDPNNDSQNINRAVSELEPGHFILSGLWQTDVNGSNYIQVLRNTTASRRKDHLGKRNWFGIPVTWEDCQIKKAVHRRFTKIHLFVTIEARFDPESQRFIFVQLLCTPRRNIPSHQKIIRVSLPKKDCPKPTLRSARFIKDFVKLTLANKSALMPQSQQLGLNFELEVSSPIEKYPESELKVLMGYARSSPVAQIKNVQEATPVALFDRQGNNIGTFAFRREGRTKYWEKLAS